MAASQGRKEIIFIALCAAALAFVSCSEKDEWRYLLDEDLSNFEIYQSFEFTTPEYHGYPLDENGEKIPQIGYNKNYKDLFTVDMVDGEPILHVNGMTYGCVFTKEQFSNYIINLKVKFGENRYFPRKNLAMDSGLLYHSQGEGGIELRLFDIEGGLDGRPQCISKSIDYID